MQNQPIRDLLIELSSIDLPEDFPAQADIESGFVPDQHIDYLHYHNCLEIGYCHEGSGIFLVEKKILPFSRGDAVIFSTNERHLAQSNKGVVSQWTWIYADAARLHLLGNEPAFRDAENLAGDDFVNVLHEKDHAPLVGLVKGMIAELKERKEGYRLAFRALLSAFIVQLHRTAKSTSPAITGEDRETFARISPALSFIARNHMEPIAMARLAKLCGLSSTTFRRLFKSATNRSPLQYLNLYRLQIAGTLLRTTKKPVLQISLETGFPTLSSFNRAFQNVFHQAPRVYRKAGDI